MVDLRKAVVQPHCEKSSSHVTVKQELHSACSPFRREVVYDPCLTANGREKEPLLSRTRQEFADDCDINLILRDYEKNGWPPADPSRPPVYFDCTRWTGDLRTHLDQIHEAQDAFMRLPADVRAEFYNDPLQFVEFASDPAHLEQMREWGLAPKPEAPVAPMKVEVVNQPAPGPGASASS